MSHEQTIKMIEDLKAQIEQLEQVKGQLYDKIGELEQENYFLREKLKDTGYECDDLARKVAQLESDKQILEREKENLYSDLAYERQCR